MNGARNNAEKYFARNRIQRALSSNGPYGGECSLEAVNRVVIYRDKSRSWEGLLSEIGVEGVNGDTVHTTSVPFSSTRVRRFKGSHTTADDASGTASNADQSSQALVSTVPQKSVHFDLDERLSSRYVRNTDIAFED